MRNPNTSKLTHCEIDGVVTRSYRCFLVHLKKIGVTQKEYHSKYIKQPSDGICPVCTNETKFNSIGRGYDKFCSPKCFREYKKTPEYIARCTEKVRETKLKRYGKANYVNLDKIKKTKLDRYGSENYVNSEKNKQTCLERYDQLSCTGTDKYKESYEKTCLEKYGTDHHTKSGAVKKKSKETCRKKYGVEYSLQSPEVRKKIDKTLDEKYGGYTLGSPVLNKKMKKTMMEKYGVETPLESYAIRSKVRKTNLKKYGGLSPTASPEIIQKIKQTNLKRYGVENTFNTPQVKNTFLERYGVSNPSQIDGHSEKVKSTNFKKYGNEVFMLSDTFKAKSKKTCLEKYGYEHAIQSPDIYIPLMKKLGSNRYKIEEYNSKWNTKIRYQSKPELEFINYCENLDLFVENGPVLNYTFKGKQKVYYVDFIVTDRGSRRLVEIKRKHKWWYNDLKSGKIMAKAKTAIAYSKSMGYLPYKILFETKLS